MTDRPVEPAGPESRPETCEHPWLRVVCGECGQPVDMLALDVIRPPVPSVDLPLGDPEGPEPEGSVPGAIPGRDRGSVFVVARGHSELVEQLRAVMGQSPDIQIIEDRRLAQRGSGSHDDTPPPPSRGELRKRILEDELADSDPGSGR